MPNLRRPKVTTAYGTLAFGSVAAGYAALKAGITQATHLIFFNSCDQDVVISLDAGTTDWCNLPAGTSFMLNLAANSLEYSGAIHVKRGAGGAPSSGFVSVTTLGIVG